LDFPKSQREAKPYNSFLVCVFINPEFSEIKGRRDRKGNEGSGPGEEEKRKAILIMDRAGYNFLCLKR